MMTKGLKLFIKKMVDLLVREKDVPQLAKGDYIIKIDGDDYVDDDYLLADK